jgi:hypothetical protein
LFLRRRGEEKEARKVFERVARLKASWFTYWNLTDLSQGEPAD